MGAEWPVLAESGLADFGRLVRKADKPPPAGRPKVVGTLLGPTLRKWTLAQDICAS
jgi:hypothetical protein